MESRNLAFEEALARSHQRWKDDARIFAPATPEVILAEVTTLNNEGNRSRVRRFVRRLDKVVRGFEGFFKAVDAFVSANPAIAGLVWGGIQFVIQIVSNYASYFDKVVNILEMISRNLYFYHRYATAVYKESSRVMTALVDVYDDILTVLMEVKATFFDSSGKKRGFLNTTAHVLNPWQKTFDDVIGNFELRNKLLDQETTHEDRERLVEEKQVQQLHYLRESLQFEDSSCVRAHDAAKLAASSNQDSGNWLLRHDEYRRWCEAESPREAGLCWIHGNPGSGKTVLASIVIEHLRGRQNSNQQSAVLYFYCDYRDSNKVKPGNILRSLLEQLLGGLKPRYSDPIIAILNDHSSSTSLPADLMLEIIATVSKEYQGVTFVIDALDECQNRAETKILPLLLKLSETLRLVITSRKEEDIRLSLGIYAKAIIPLTHENCRDDILSFVLSTLESYSAQKRFLREEALKGKIINSIVDNAHGMFLWVSFQMHAIQRCGSAAHVEEALGDLPEGLDKTFVRSLRTIHELAPRLRACVKRILRWVICTGNILLQDLFTIISVEEMTDCWKEANIIEDWPTMIGHCAHLVSLEEDSGSTYVVPTHHSVYLFLTSDPSALTEMTPRLSYYCIYPLSSGYEACGVSLQKYLKLRPCPEAVTFACNVAGAWVSFETLGVKSSNFWSVFFAAPLAISNPFSQPKTVPGTFPEVKVVVAVECSFIQAEYAFNVFPGPEPSWASGFNTIFPNVQDLHLVRSVCIATPETVVTIYQSPGAQEIRIGSQNPKDDSDDDNSFATVMGMKFIQATESCWDIYPCNGMHQNFTRSSVTAATLLITGGSLITSPVHHNNSRNKPPLFDSQDIHFEGVSTGECSTKTLRIREVTMQGGEFITHCRL